MAEKKRKAKKKVAKKKATRKVTSKKKATAKKKRRPREKKMDRAEQMTAMRAEGHTFEDIAQQFGVSRQRVHQLVSGAELAATTAKKTKAASNGGPNTELLRGRGIQEKIRQYEAVEADAKTAEVGDRIVYCRLKRGLTIGQLAQESEVPYGVLSTYENNKAQPSCESLKKLCTALRVSAHWIIFGHGFRRAEA